MSLEKRVYQATLETDAASGLPAVLNFTDGKLLIDLDGSIASETAARMVADQYAQGQIGIISAALGANINTKTTDGINFYSMTAGPMISTFVNSFGVVFDLFFTATAANQGPVTMSGGLYNWVKIARDRVIVNLEKFGASPAASAAINDQALADAIGSMASGQELKIPGGDYNFNSCLFNPPDDCVLDCYGTLVSSTSGDAFTLGGTGNTWRFRYDVRRLKVKSPSRDITTGRTGIRMQNLYESALSIDRVEGFEKGILCWGDSTTQFIGFSYNKVSLGRIVDNKFGMYLDHGATWGFVNENVFYGGRFSWSSAVTNASNHVHIFIADKTVEPINSNRFEKPNLEAVNGSWNSAPGVQRAGVRAYVDNGIHNKIIDARVEWETSTGTTTMFTLGVNSKYPLIEGGFDTLNTNIEDLSVAGSYRAWTRSGITIKTIDTLSPALALQAQAANSQILFQLKGLAGTVNFQIDALGNTLLNELILGALAVNQKIKFGSGSPETVVTGYQGSFYVDNNGNATRIWLKGSGSGNTGWVELKGVRFSSSNVTVPIGPGCELTYLMNAAGGARAAFLPLAINAPAMAVRLIKTDASANAVTYTPAGSDTMSGTPSITAQDGVKTYVSDGVSRWYSI